MARKRDRMIWWIIDHNPKCGLFTGMIFHWNDIRLLWAQKSARPARFLKVCPNSDGHPSWRFPHRSNMSKMEMTTWAENWWKWHMEKAFSQMRPNDFQATWRECGRNAASPLQDLLDEYVAHKHPKNTQAHSAPFCIRYIYIHILYI